MILLNIHLEIVLKKSNFMSNGLTLLHAHKVSIKGEKKERGKGAFFALVTG